MLVRREADLIGLASPGASIVQGCRDGGLTEGRESVRQCFDSIGRQLNQRADILSLRAKGLSRSEERGERRAQVMRNLAGQGRSRKIVAAGGR